MKSPIVSVGRESRGLNQPILRHRKPYAGSSNPIGWVSIGVVMVVSI